MKKHITSIILGLCLSLFLLPVTAQAAGPTSDSCGQNATWSYDAATKTLTISGSGAMDDSQLNNRGYEHCRTDAEKLVIESGITAIGNNAFSGFETLTSVSLPDSVTAIGEQAFSFCKALTSVVIPDGVTSIGLSAFGGCSSLKNIDIPKNVTTIGESAFADCRKLTSVDIPDSVTSIEDSLFAGCSSLTSVTIPKDVTSIGKRAFYQCGSLTSITIPAGVTSIKGEAFDQCASLQDVYYGGSKAQWDAISINNENNGNDVLGNANIHCTCTVTFDLSYTGAPAAATSQVNSGDKITKPTDPTRAGYTFGGWYKEAVCTTAWDFTNDTVTSDITLYAKWTVAAADIYTVTFDLNYTGAPAAATSQVNSGDEITKPTDPTREGYTFGGWYKEAACTTVWDFDTDTVTGNITLYAKWTAAAADIYTVTFDLNYTDAPAAATSQVNSGDRITKPTDPTRSGYTFGGWYKEAACTTAWSFGTDTVTGDITLYAKWTANSTTPPAGDDEDEYRIYGPGSISGGRVYISHTTAEPGTRVTIELRPWRDYELNWISAVNLDTDRELRLTERYSDEYTFIMPAGDVEVDAAFYDRYYYYSGTYYVQEEEPVQVRPVKWYYSNGRIYHVTDGLVPYGSLLTRDMLLSVLYNMDPASTGDPTAWATNNGIIPDIYTSILWGTDKPINREQTAMILFCYAQHMGYNTAQRTDLTGYADYRQIRDIARPAVSWARAVGIISGSSATTLSPQAVLTCDQANSILSRFSVSVARQW